jgi:hypothetical protein
MAIEYALAPQAAATPSEISAFLGWLDYSFSQIPATVEFTSADVEPAELMDCWRVTGRLLISEAHGETAPWDAETNRRFRAVHDWHHILTGAGFGWEGEKATYDYACATAPEMIHWILRSEILLQAAYRLETGSFAAEQKLVRV